MFNLSTVRWIVATVALAGWAVAQPVPDWRQTGNTVVGSGLAGHASGPVDRVWFSGGSLFAQTRSGRIFITNDMETWRRAGTVYAPAARFVGASSLPEPAVSVVDAGGGHLYAFGTFVYASDDGGKSWNNLTADHAQSIVGTGLHDLAVVPGNSEELVVAGDAGVFHSVDAGRSWSSLNEGLPNFPVTRIVSLPVGAEGLRVALTSGEVAWPPGNKLAWIPARADDLTVEDALRSSLTGQFGVPVTAVAVAGDYLYAGTQAGEIRVSPDGGRTWLTNSAYGSGAVERFWIDPSDPRIALAAMGRAPEDPFRSGRGAQVLHTVNGGAFWDDFTANLPDSSAHGVAADLASGAIYIATDIGVFLSYADLDGLGTVEPWVALPGLPDAAVTDVMLDARGSQLWAAVDGYGVYSTLAPHRLRDPRVVSAADLVTRAVAPGSLVTILGAKVDAVRVNGVSAPVLATSAAESQIQIPYDVRGEFVSLDAGRKLSSAPLSETAPVIFVARDGTPMLVDAETGVMLDATNPARPGMRVQILAAGLGRVTPAWPAGTAAPLDNPPRTEAAVRAFLDRSPVEVTRSVLAPGFTGFYLVEIEIPRITNYGPAELYLDADGAASNPVRVYIEP